MNVSALRSIGNLKTLAITAVIGIVAVGGWASPTRAAATEIVPRTITFDANGGTVNTESATTLESGKLASLPTPSRTGFAFGGWFTTETCDTAVTLNTVYNADATLFASWAIANATFITEEFTSGVFPSGWLRTLYGQNNDGGFLMIKNGDDYRLRTSLIYSSSTPHYIIIPDVTLGADPTLSFYSHLWDANNESGNSTGNSYGSIAISVSTDNRTSWKDVQKWGLQGATSDNIIGTKRTVSLANYVNQTVTIRITCANETHYGMYAMLDNIQIVGARYRVTFDNDDNTDGLHDVFTASPQTSYLPTPTRDGYTFTGWFTTPTATGGAPVTTNTLFAANTVLYARWMPPYTVTFNAGGGAVAPVSDTTVVGDTLISLPTPTKTNYDFVGWFTEATGGTQVTTSTPFTANTTVYAQWTPTVYAISYILDGGAITPDDPNPKEYNVESAAFTLINPARAGYYFAGWTGTNGTIPQTNVSVPAGSVGDRNYTANWTPVVHAETPIIAAQPVGGLVEYGASHTLSITAAVDDGGTLSYQWYRNISASNIGGAPITGATSASYTQIMANGTFYYYVVVTNNNAWATDVKTASVTSNAVTVGTDAGAPADIWNGTITTNWYTSNISANTYSINTADELAGLASLVNSGITFSGKTINLAANIMLNDTTNWQNWPASVSPARSWTPIGSYTAYSSSTTRPFEGTFDGNGHIVSGVYINNVDSVGKQQGLFGYSRNGIVKNTGVLSSFIRGTQNTGGLIGLNFNGTVRNCYFVGNVSGTVQVGGLVGYSNGGTIINSYAMGSVTLVSGTNNTIGGLVGATSNDAKITNCYATGRVAASGGGLLGAILNSAVLYSYWDTETSKHSASAGGIGRTTEQMKVAANFTAWDFTDTWQIIEGVDYPRLQGVISGSGPANRYTITFDANGGTGTLPVLTGIAHGTRLGEAQKPSIETVIDSGYVSNGKWYAVINPGYVSDGKWYIDADGNTEFIFGSYGTPVRSDWTLYLKWLVEPEVSVLSPDRTIPDALPGADAVVIPPVSVTAFELTVGPNPVRKSDNGANIFITGKRIDKGELMIYDGSGNVIRKINVRDNIIGNNRGRRVAGSWDLRDASGRLVVTGTYLLRGVVTTVDGKRERVSLVVGVR